MSSDSALLSCKGSDHPFLGPGGISWNESMATVWFYAADNRQVGPVSEAELDALAASGAIRKDTLVWTEGMANWSPYGTVRPDAAPPTVPAPPPLTPTSASAAAPATAPEQPQTAMRFCTECGRPTPERE